MIKYTTKDFIIKAAEIHKNKYDYSLANYINSKTKIKIICPEHGIFEQTPQNHLAGKGCKKCALLKNLKNKRADINYFINRAIKIYGDKYDYSQTKYINYRTPIKIICPEHGEFYKAPSVFLGMKQGCKLCGENKRINASRDSTNDFIEKALKIHGKKYNYSLTNYFNSHTPIKIICPIHGMFEQLPYVHLQKHGCPKCGDIGKSLNKRKKQENFILEANKIHFGKYDYSCVEYIGNNKKVKIICPEHGVFYQKPTNHLKGEGCPFCKGSYGEQIIFWLLKTIFNEEFKFQWKNSFCKNQLCLPFDFYLPKRNMVIEFMGEQHYKFCSFFYRTIKEFHKRRHIDWLKRKFCYDSDIIYYKIDYNENIYDKLKEIFYE